MNVGLYELRFSPCIVFSLYKRTDGRETNQTSSQPSPSRVYGVVQRIEILMRRRVLDINGNKVKDVMMICARLLVSSKLREGGTEGGGGGGLKTAVKLGGPSVTDD